MNTCCLNIHKLCDKILSGFLFIQSEDGQSDPLEEAKMLFGVSIFATDYTMHPADLARALEERGFESLWLDLVLTGWWWVPVSVASVCLAFPVPTLA